MLHSVNAQSVTPSAVTSSGGKLTQSNGSLSFTVGELVVETQTDGNGNALGGGFTNGSTSSTTITAIKQPNPSLLSMDIYPNPTSDMLTLDIKHVAEDAYTINIIDINGKQVYDARHAGLSGIININVAPLARGTYLLKMMSNKNELLGSYQIVLK